MKFKKTVIIALFSICTFVTFVLFNKKATQTQTATGNQDLHVIFDMHGVLVRTKPQKGIKKLFAGILTPSIKRELFSFLDSIEPRNADEIYACDEYGNVMPQIMCDWLKGTQTPEQLIAAIDARNKKGMVPSIAKDIFDPETFANNVEWIDETIAFAKALKAQGYKLHILSNWDPASFNILKKRYPEIFNLFDGVMISGDVGLIKPDNRIYQAILEQHGINRDCACFIDDQPCNADAAHDVGIYSIQCKQKKRGFSDLKPDIEYVHSALNAWHAGLKCPAPRAA